MASIVCELTQDHIDFINKNKGRKIAVTFVVRDIKLDDEPARSISRASSPTRTTTAARAVSPTRTTTAARASSSVGMRSIPPARESAMQALDAALSSLSSSDDSSICT